MPKKQRLLEIDKLGPRLLVLTICFSLGVLFGLSPGITHNHSDTSVDLSDRSVTDSLERDDMFFAAENLKAQKTLASWTAIMGGAALVGISLSSLGVWLIYRTWTATREAAENSRKTLQAYIGKERAFLRATGASVISTENALSDQFGVVIGLENVGLSMGRVKRIIFAFNEHYGWRPENANELFCDVLVPAESNNARSPWLRIPDRVEGNISGYFEYVTLEGESYRTYFSYAIFRNDNEIFEEAYWEARTTLPLGMPSNT